MSSVLTENFVLAEGREKYNEHCKELLSCRQILARILQGTTEEFVNVPVDIIRNCIEGTPQISKIPVFQDALSNEKIIGSDTLNTTPKKGMIAYDVRFVAYAPEEETSIKLYVNMEAQKTFHRKYSLVTRGVYYGARMISSQYGVEFKNSEYDKIKKVYSIWICNDAPEYMGNSVIKYSIQKEDIAGYAPDKKWEYDKMTLIFICLNEKAENTCELTGLLNTIFSEKLNVTEKLEILESEYHMELEESDKEALNEMCNFAEGLEEKIEKRVTERVTDSVTKSVTESVTKSVTESVTKSVTESVTKSVTESVTNSVAAEYIRKAATMLQKTGVSEEKILDLIKKECQLDEDAVKTILEA